MNPLNATSLFDDDDALIHHVGSRLDEIISQSRHVITSLADQRQTIKNAKTKLLDVANILGLSSDAIRYIQRRAKQDQWFIYGGGLILTILLVWFLYRYFR